MDDSDKKGLERRYKAILKGGTDIAKRNTRIEDYAGVGASCVTVDEGNYTPLHGGLPGAAAERTVRVRCGEERDRFYARVDFDRRARYAYSAAMERLQTEIGPEDVGNPPETMTPVMEDQYEPGTGQVTGVITAQVVYVEAARSRMDREVDAITEKAVEIAESMGVPKGA